MLKLPLELRRNGYDYKQIYRSGMVAIYEQSDKIKKYGYEVFEIKSHNGRTIKGMYIEPSELFPSNESFGHHAWTVPTIERAMQKAEEIQKRLQERTVVQQ